MKTPHISSFATLALANGSRRLPQHQRGIVLIIALIVLVAMTLAGIAMIRQAGTGLGIAGNLAFRQNASSGADYGIETARQWLLDGKSAADLQVAVGNGYLANWNTTNTDGVLTPNFNPAKHRWDAQSVVVTNDDGTGNKISYVIHRMCQLDGAVNQPGQQCVTTKAVGEGGDQSRTTPTQSNVTNSVQPFFRVTAKAEGPRNTVSYTQILMY